VSKVKYSGDYLSVKILSLFYRKEIKEIKLMTKIKIKKKTGIPIFKNPSFY
jgi:hypothetical protein